MLNRHVKLAVLLSAAWLSQASATAGEVTLFSGPGFQGRDVTVREPMRDLNALGFNDRSGSMIVRSGRWEVCVDADFRNQCQVFEPGEYGNLARMTNAITSLREVDGGRGDGYRDNRDDNRGAYRDDNRGGYRDDDRDGRGEGRARHRRERTPSVQLFDSPDLRGRSIVLREQVENLSSLNFNDRTQSMVVESGTWEFCQHNDFGGRCKVYEPGQYRNLERGFSRMITSARVLEQDRSRGNGRRNDDQGRREGVELYADEGFGGERMLVREEIRNLAEHNYNDRAGSLIVYSGQWEFCQHGDFRGQCMTYGPGRYDRLGSLNDQISSIRRVR